VKLLVDAVEEHLESESFLHTAVVEKLTGVGSGHVGLRVVNR
jgi:hypothetical protein